MARQDAVETLRGLPSCAVVADLSYSMPELNCIVFTSQFVRLENLRILNLKGLRMVDLMGLPPVMERVETVNLSENRLRGELDVVLRCFPNLKHLDLSENSICDVRALRPIRLMGALVSLDLTGNRATRERSYASEMAKNMPNGGYEPAGMDTEDSESSSDESVFEEMDAHLSGDDEWEAIDLIPITDESEESFDDTDGTDDDESYVKVEMYQMGYHHCHGRGHE